MKKNNFFYGVLIGISVFFVINLSLHNGIFHIPIMSPDAKINQIFSLLDKYYVDKYDRDDAKDSMYYGLLYSLGDPYTSYMDKKTFKKFMEQTEGSYIGIGTVISINSEDNSLVVVSPYENSPAAKAGILPGDKILSVDGTIASKENYEQIINKLKGSIGTIAKIRICRPTESNNVFEFDIERKKINIPTVTSKLFDKNDNDIGYLRITNFDRNTYQQFVEAYNKLKNNSTKLKGLIIDLRNNPGGLLDSVVKIADELLPKACIVYTEDKCGNKKYCYSNSKYIKLPLILIVNENSASASEVLSGAVKDLQRGKLVGTKTFGKGLVQNLFTLQDGSAVKITIAKYYTPSGICINGKGIKPDYEVKMQNDKLIYTLSLNEDLQLQKALEILDKQLSNN